MLFLLNSASFLDVIKVIILNEFLQNSSFEVPIISGAKSYNALTDSEKLKFKWLSGGNFNNGVAISDGGTGYGFPTFVTGQQALAITHDSYIEQLIYLNVGTYIFSTYFISRFGNENNPINISIDDVLLTNINQVVTTWTLFTYEFNILEEGNKLIRLEGTSPGDITTGIDLVGISRKPETITPFPLTSLKTTVDTYEGAESYKNGIYFVSNSSSLGPDTTGFGVYSTSGQTWYSANKYFNFNGSYNGTVVTILQDGTELKGEYLQIRLPFAFTLSSYELRGEGNSTSNNRTLPIRFYMVGSIDGKEWFLVDEYYNPDAIINPLIVEVPKPYVFYRLIVNATKNINYVNISFLKFTGN
jgi:hypothetical protein